MKYYYYILIVISIVSACNNFCNNHGICGAYNRCECYPGWGGADCSLRGCPYGEGFVDIILGDLDHDGQIKSDPVYTEWQPKTPVYEDLNYPITSTGRAHRYAECSNAGLCNRETGECECFPGYEGSSCQRKSCPSSSENNTCSGHGICVSSEEIINRLSDEQKYVSWETDKYYVCKCDKGFEGIDCGNRKCPQGIDPLNSDAEKGTYTYFIETNYGTDTPSLSPSPDILYVENYVIKYIKDGVSYVTPTIYGRSSYCTDTTKKEIQNSKASEMESEIKSALLKIPLLNQVDVEVKCTDKDNEVFKSASGDNKYHTVIGDKPDIIPPRSEYSISVTLNLNSVDLLTYKNDKIMILKNVVMKDGSKTLKDKGIQQAYNAPFLKSTTICASRGKCNTLSGECECFDGYYGNACQMRKEV